jgi:uncharacterized protein YcaQ
VSKPIALSADEARRIALRAQGFGAPRPRAAKGADLGHVRRLVRRLGAVQIDAVNVLVRSHHLPAFSRIGPYPLGGIDRLAFRRKAMFEYWGHAASFLPIELHPALRWRMDRHATHEHWARVRARLDRERPGYVDAVLREITERGPLTFTDLTDPGRLEKVKTKYADSTLLWWRWADGKTVLEGLFDAGRVAVAGRRRFERLYDLTERVIPDDVLALPTPPVEDAQRQLVAHSARALGVATIRDLADYFRLASAVTRARVRELVERGDLQPATIEGWTDAAYLDPSAPATAVDARALLSPFDSLVWARPRSERLFAFTHSFELYVPEAKRRFGYYVLPFLLGEHLVGRVDLKADRAGNALLVQGAFAEPGTTARAVVGELTGALRELAAWLELDRVQVGTRGDLAPALRRALPKM